jgi:hypothetical protein
MAMSISPVYLPGLFYGEPTFAFGLSRAVLNVYQSRPHNIPAEQTPQTPRQKMLNRSSSSSSGVVVVVVVVLVEVVVVVEEEVVVVVYN